MRPVWWNDDLTASKIMLNNFKAINQWKGRNNDAYKVIRSAYLALIRRSKTKSWKDFVTSINDDQWGSAYKWIKSRNIQEAITRQDGTLTQDYNEIAEHLLETVTPSDKHDNTDDLD